MADSRESRSVFPTRQSRVALDTPAPDRLAAALRHAEPPVIGRIEDNRVLLDLRAILPEQDAILVVAIQGALTTDQ